MFTEVKRVRGPSACDDVQQHKTTDWRWNDPRSLRQVLTDSLNSLLCNATAPKSLHTQGHNLTAQPLGVCAVGEAATTPPEIMMQRVRRLNSVDRSRIFMELHRANTPCLASIARPCACRSRQQMTLLKHTLGCESCHTDR